MFNLVSFVQEDQAPVVWSEGSGLFQVAGGDGEMASVEQVVTEGKLSREVLELVS